MVLLSFYLPLSLSHNAKLLRNAIHEIHRNGQFNDNVTKLKKIGAVAEATSNLSVAMRFSLCSSCSALKPFQQVVSNDADVIANVLGIMLICNDTCVCLNSKNSLRKRFAGLY